MGPTQDADSSDHEPAPESAADADAHFFAMLSAAQRAAADIALITDADQAITYVSESFTAMTGYEERDLLGVNCRVLQGPGTDSDTRTRMRDTIASGGIFEGQILNYRKDGSAFWTALKIIPVRADDDSRITHFVSVQRDISNKVALLQEAQDQARHDHVTGLLNRRAAEQTLAAIVRRPLPHHQVRTQDRGLGAAIGLIDLDDFRDVNNTYGHPAGDEVLRQWATRMLAHLREGDVLARMGGDEFLLILATITRATADEDLRGILGRIHAAVEEPFLVDGHHIRIGMSMGLTLVPEDGTDSSTILRHADEALYTAKRRDRHSDPWWGTATRIATSASTDAGAGAGAETGERSSTSTRERTGTGTYREVVRNGKVLVHFQPIVDLNDGSVVYLEALARLALPGGRIADPDEFLPHLTPDDLLVLFTDVLDQGLALIAAWDGAGLRPNMSVNLPPEILNEPTLPALILETLHAYGIEPGGLGLELLESPTESLEEQRTALQELARLGVGLAMDDLGSGHSSLQRLSSFPFHAIKLDRGLLEHAQDKPLETLSIMATLVQMGRDLGMTVIIEGLENEALTEAATILGAPLGQGYHLARPMSARECRSWFNPLDLSPRPSEIRTPLGALAYHWQFARLSSPHPLGTQGCPLTHYITTATATPADSGTSSDVESWHALQHAPNGMHPAASRLLIQWLTHHIQAPTPNQEPHRPTEPGFDPGE